MQVLQGTILGFLDLGTEVSRALGSMAGPQRPWCPRMHFKVLDVHKRLRLVLNIMASDYRLPKQAPAALVAQVSEVDAGLM